MALPEHFDVDEFVTRALAEDLEQEDRTGDRRVERVDRATHGQPHEEVAAAPDGWRQRRDVLV